ncbi:MAG: TIGR04013 family B12-binding domain/radical SAM domain-containing protein [Methanosarcinaceae archaeon]|nr:TIGR04013 family B12-binding domain/radical SAM domain-containing protein [Methanosarcinaceae archaeon]
MDVNLRLHRKNSYSIAALAPLLPGATLVSEPHDGIMVYSFPTRQKDMFFAEVDNSKTDSIYIAGGPHPTGAPTETLEHFDYVVIGEGEETLPELIEAIRSGTDTGQIRGITYLQNGNIIYTDPRRHVDLDQYPCFEPEGVHCPIEISRGCPYRCKYCQTPYIFGHRMRHRSIDSIVRCAQHYRDLRFTSSNAFAYGSDGVHPQLDKVEKLLSALNQLEDKNIYFGTFPSEVRPDFVTDQALELIVDHCTNSTISLGGQSGSDRILERIRRGHTVRDVITAVERCSIHGITPAVDIIFGFPDETEEEQLRTLELIRWIIKNNGQVRAHYLTPLPSTPYANVVPVKVCERVRQLLGAMARDGNLTGTWEC